MSTDLERIGEKARNDPELVFTSLYHHVSDVGNLRACYDALPGNRAVGVDGVTKEEYGKHLEANLHDLSGRLRRNGLYFWAWCSLENYYIGKTTQRIWCPERKSGIWKELNETPLANHHPKG